MQMAKEITEQESQYDFYNANNLKIKEDRNYQSKQTFSYFNVT